MNKERPVALVHSYLKDREGKDRPDRLTRACLLAAAELYRRGEVEKIVITVEPELSEPMRKQMKAISSIEDDDLVVEPQTVTTEGEVKTFKEIAERESWESLLTIGNSGHLPRIERTVNKYFGDSKRKVTSVSARDVLSRYPRYQKVLDDMETWPEQKSHKMQEIILEQINRVPLLGRVLSSWLLNRTAGKVAMQTWAMRQIEKLMK